MIKSNLTLLGLILLLAFTSCSKFSKIIKEPDPDLRFDAAIEYYNDDECLKSMTILEDLLPIYRGTKKSEDVYYYYAKSNFCTEDYILAGFYMKQFVKTFPQSKYSEECSYLGAICAFKESPGNSLDQSETNKALSELEVFIDRYPETDKKDTITSLISILKSKLEVKDYENAKLYHKTLNFKSAVIAYNSFLKEYPATKLREEIMFNIVQANYSLAINSIERKKEGRLKETVKSYNTFAAIFPESESLAEAQRLQSSAQKELDKLKD